MTVEAQSIVFGKAASGYNEVAYGRSGNKASQRARVG